MTFFPDAQHVDAIRRALWAGHGSGRAVAMIGSGMSRNAMPRRSGTFEMPTWWQIVSAMIDRLYPDGSGLDKQRKSLRAQAGATSVSLRLADEFAAAFGRGALDELIISMTPDQDYAPGDLHRALIGLPWADVLTTNYDTLLERAAEESYGRSYSVVRSQAELPAGVRPRIVKLHGSFPSNRPFVFSEEDFRTYPRRFAAFVNLARQAVLENVLVLIGFSGDDPNFLAWTGWVRDQLAEYTPRIYLCGLLDLTNAQRSVLQGRGVIPVDLSPQCPKVTGQTSHNRHRSAIHWLLENLKSGRPYDPNMWPKSDATASLPKTLGPNGSAAIRAEPYSPRDLKGVVDTAPASQLNTVAAIWKNNRELYPGWLVAPAEVRNRLSDMTSNEWQYHYLQNRKSLNATDNIAWLHEMNWRFETALAPLWDHLIVAYEEALEAQISKRAVEAETDGAEQPHQREELTADGEVRDQWLALACSLLRYYREERKWVENKKWGKRLSALQHLSPDMHARLCYEQSLRGLAMMDDSAIGHALASWPAYTQDPCWTIRRAGILAEIGRLDEALSVIAGCLDSIRRGLEDADRHIFALSREGWALMLAGTIERALSSGNPHVRSHESSRTTLQQRFRQLVPFGCNPDDVTEDLHIRLQSPPPVRQAPVQIRNRFEPGRTTRTSHGGDRFWEKLLPAYQVMRLTEVTGVPPRVGNVFYHGDSFRNAAAWLQEHDPVRTQSLMFRLLDEKVVESYLSRHRLAALPVGIVEQWRAACQKIIHETIPEVGTGFRNTDEIQSRNRHRLQTAAAVLARTAVRCDALELEKLWELLVTLCKSRECRLTMFGEDVVKQILDSLIQSSPVHVLSKCFGNLLEIPVPGEPGHEVWREGYWPDPAIRVGSSLLNHNAKPTLSQLQVVVDKSLQMLASDNHFVRTAHLTRLFILDRMGLMTQANVGRVGRLFWSDTSKSGSLPFERWKEYTLLHATVWPSPTAMDAPAAVKAHLLQSSLEDVHPFSTSNNWSDDVVRVSDPRESRESFSPIRWTQTEKSQLFQIVINWWQNHGTKNAEQYVKGSDSMFFDGSIVCEHLTDIWEVVRDVILPGQRGKTALGGSINKLISDVQTAGLPVGAVLPALIRNGYRSVDAVTQGLESEMTSRNRDFRLSALRGIVYWSKSRSRGRHARLQAPPPVDLIRLLGNAIAMRHSGELRLLLNGALAILEAMKSKADNQFVSSVIRGLQNLYAEVGYRDRRGNDDLIHYEDVPAVRMQCVRLARHLQQHGKRNNPVVEQWVKAAVSDPLPEIHQIVQ